MSYQLNDVNLMIGQHHILKNITMRFNQGEIHAIMGGNGAGKSSLMKILAGIYKATDGEVLSNNESIAFVAQEVDEVLFNDLSVYDNLMLDDLKKGLIYYRKNSNELQQRLDEWKVTFKLDTLVKELSIADKQQLVIIRAIQQGHNFLILDEPTASLSTKEVEHLLDYLKQLKARNIGIIFISHRIPEVLAVADTITLMQEGRIVKQGTTADETTETLLAAITSNRHQKAHKSHPGNTITALTDYTDHQLKQLNIELKAGEITGIAGLLGAGKTELAETFYLRERRRTAYIPEERQKNGLVGEYSIIDNVNFHQKRLFIHAADERKKTEELAQKVKLKYQSLNQSVRTLSGGNQQKVVLMKGLASNKEIFIFDEPTAGIDAAAKQDIFYEIGQLAAAGKAILYLTSDVEELLTISHKIYVLHQGRIIMSDETAAFTESTLLHYATGGESYEI